MWEAPRPAARADEDERAGGNERHEPARVAPTRRIAVALQGGGSHGAFTWGVLERLLREPDLEIVGISGTSAGAMNAGILADGLRRGGPEEARRGLARYWDDVGRLPGFASIAPSMAANAQPAWHLDHNPLFLYHDILTRVWSPYQTNPLNYNPLRPLLERIDVIVVGINPIVRASVPRTARGIIDRIGEISFNSTFMLELSAIAFIEDLMKTATVPQPFRSLFVHGIGDEALGTFGASSKMNNDPRFLRHLH